MRCAEGPPATDHSSPPFSTHTPVHAPWVSDYNMSNSRACALNVPMPLFRCLGASSLSLTRYRHDPAEANPCDMQVRSSGGIPVLAWLLAEESIEVRQKALLVLGNLCSDAVDPNSAATKRDLLHCGGSRALFSCLDSDKDHTLLLACGALQNLCFDPQWAKEVMHNRLQARLEGLLTHEDELVVRYASGALTNLAAQLRTEALSEEALAAVRQRASQAECERHKADQAIKAITRAVRTMPPESRQRWRQLARERLAQAQHICF